MIAAAFPPTGGSGVQRTAKFAKYLPDFGWLPVVWTSDHMPGLPRDPELLSDLPPQSAIHRWNRGLSARRWQRRLRDLGERVNALSRLARAIDWRLEAWIANRARPDDHAAWAKTSVPPLRRLIQRDEIDIIYSTFSPVSDHVLALELKTATKRPWVADFRDLWTEDFRYDGCDAVRCRADRELERRILDQADAVIGVSPRQTEILAARVPSQRAKFLTITNGFDPDDFRSRRRELPPGSGGQFVLSYVGRFDRYRINDALLDGFRQFAARAAAEQARFLFRVVGHCTDETRARVLGTGLSCDFVGPVSHAEAIREMAAADALLLSADDTGRHAGSVISGKTFEYLASGRPILCVGSRDGDGERIVRSCEAGIAAPFEAGAIAESLRMLYDGWRSGSPIRGCTPDRLEPYSRVTLTRKLASVLDGLVTSTFAPRGRPQESTLSLVP